MYFPAGFFDDGPLSMLPRRIRWSDVTKISATYDNAGKVSAVNIELAAGAIVTMKISSMDILNPEAEVLFAFAFCAEDKLSPDALNRHKEHRAESYRRGLESLAKRSDEDARVVAVMTDLAQKGAGAPEIMKAIFDVRYGTRTSTIKRTMLKGSLWHQFIGTQIVCHPYAGNSCVVVTKLVTCSWRSAGGEP